ncbi:alpha/beta fold hydrolase [Sphingomicrobium sediminis]|uniref:Alpha/beta hydrolase n=1 Tax=Sphingomicrobium sediminis TaxID=2950949 RepID=A0A9X2J244_9SPHN|nr:alpha/beta hydrolase [Sphingomicrobium sediminis]MCM8557903.1 alpha/beta hydrolase [Sphingomicrobium sediminis]
MQPIAMIAAALAATATPLPAFAETHPTFSAEDATPDRFSVEVLGEGDEDVILIPGLLSPRSVWEGQVDTLLASGARVHLVQVDGFGDTDPGKNAEGPVLPFLVSDIAKYIETNGLGTARIVGHSMGGFTALNLALDKPWLVEEIMIVDSLPFFSVLMGMETPEAAEGMAAGMRDMMVAQASMDLPAPDCDAPSMQAQSMAVTKAAQCKVDAYTASADLAVGGNLMYDIMTTDLRPRLAELEVPVTMLYPIAEPLSAEMAAGIYPVQYEGTPDITFVPVEGARHFIMLDQPDQMNAALLAFLADD